MGSGWFMESGWFEDTLETLWELENDIAELTEEYNEYTDNITDVFNVFTKYFSDIVEGLRDGEHGWMVYEFVNCECGWLIFRSGEFSDFEFNIRNSTIICDGVEYKLPFHIISKFRHDSTVATAELREWITARFTEFVNAKKAFVMSGALRNMDAEEAEHNAKFELLKSKYEQLKSLADELGFDIVSR